MKHLATSLIGALTLCAVAPAVLAAAAADEPRRQVVTFADLDLTRPAGARQLYLRIWSAARNVCETYDRLGPDRRCMQQAIARAIATVGVPLLTARHRAALDDKPAPAREARRDDYGAQDHGRGG